MSTDDERIRAQAAKWIVALENNDSVATRTEFAAWIDADPRHREVFERVSGRLVDFDRLAPQRQARGARLDAHRHVRRRRMALAAVLVAGISVGSVLVITNHTITASETRFVADEHTVRVVTLPDRSTVTLDAGSTLVEQFSADTRKVSLLRGRARFAVAPDLQRRPFAVAVEGTVVTARATLFDVERGANGLVRVALFTGALDVAAAGDAKSIALRAGQRAAFDRGSLRSGPFATHGQSRWPTGLLDFDDEALTDAVAEINRYNDLQIDLAPALRARRITGAFRARDPVAFADAVAAMFGFEVYRTAAGRLEIRAPQRI